MFLHSSQTKTLELQSSLCLTYSNITTVCLRSITSLSLKTEKIKALKTTIMHLEEILFKFQTNTELCTIQIPPLHRLVCEREKTMRHRLRMSSAGAGRLLPVLLPSSGRSWYCACPSTNHHSRQVCVWQRELNLTQLCLWRQPPP